MGADADGATKATAEADPTASGFVTWFVDWCHRKRSPLALLFVSLIASSAYLGYLVRVDEASGAGAGSERLESVAGDVAPERSAPDSTASKTMTPGSTVPASASDSIPGSVEADEYPLDVSADAVSMKTAIVTRVGQTTTSSIALAPAPRVSSVTTEAIVATPTPATAAPVPTTPAPTATVTAPTSSSTSATVVSTGGGGDDDDDGDGDDGDDGDD